MYGVDTPDSAHDQEHKEIDVHENDVHHNPATDFLESSFGSEERDEVASEAEPDYKHREGYGQDYEANDAAHSDEGGESEAAAEDDIATAAD